MRKTEEPKNFKMPKTRRTEFTNEEMLDILDFYLQYKPLFDEYITNKEHYPMNPHDFTLLLYIYGTIDVDYINNMKNIKEKYGKQYVDDLSKEKLDFLEIITIFTLIHREARNDFHNETYNYCIESNIYYNLLCRLEEIKNNIKNNSK